MGKVDGPIEQAAGWGPPAESLPAEDFQADNVLSHLGPMLLTRWTPYVRAADEVYGYVVNLLCPGGHSKVHRGPVWLSHFFLEGLANYLIFTA